MSPKKGTLEEPLSKQLVRFQVISAYLALSPKRGERGATLDKLAAKTWEGADGETFQVAAETIRTWVRRYRNGGLQGLADKERTRRGIQALPPHVIELACKLKRDVPARSIDRIIRIMEETNQVPRDVVRRSTLHRALRLRGLSARKSQVPDAHDLDRFEAAAPNDLWQSDMLVGPWLPDPERPGKMRRAHLYAFIDDHSRLLLHGRFSFKGDLPALELVFRRSLQKYGQPRRVYYDNGATYRSIHMRQIVAEIGIHGVVFTRVRRPMGHGKIEAFNRFATAAFVEEVQASKIRTLDELNEAWVAWVDAEYNERVHGETHEKPIDRWKAGMNEARWVDEEKLRAAFLWRESRKADKSGVFSLFGTKYQVSAALARLRLEIRYDPERLDEVEIWVDGRCAERVKPFQVQPNRRPTIEEDEEEAPPAPSSEPTIDWLGHLVERRRRESFVEPTPQQLANDAQQRRRDAAEQVVALLGERLDPAVRDDESVRAFVERFGPFDIPAAIAVVDELVARESRDLHVRRYLDAIRGGAR